MAEPNYREELDNLRSDFQELKADVGRLVEALKESGKDRAGNARDKARSEIDRCMDELNQAYNSVYREGQRATESVQQNIEERPLTSVILALGIGVLLGKSLSGR